jgi:tRNA dimethylallyltransferase
VRALELGESGSSLAPPEDTLWAPDTREPTLLVAVDLAPDVLDARIEARVARMIEAGAADEAKAAWAGPLGGTARNVLGLEELATMPVEDAAAAVVAATRRLARYQRKWARRLTVAATLDGDRPPGEIADEVVALAGAGERLSRS